MTIKRVSVAPGATLTANLVAVTGITSEWRSPFPTPAAEVMPDDDSIFTVDVDADNAMLTITGVAEGEGTLTLINPDVSPALRTEITVTCQYEAPGVRWELDAPVTLGGTVAPPPVPLEMEVLVNDQRVQLTFTGDGADDPKDFDWGDGNTWTQRDDNPAQYDYSENGLYTISVNGGELTADVVIEHFPRVDYQLSDPLLELAHNKGEVSTVVDWGDGTTDTELASEFSHMYAANGTYTVSVTVGFFEPETFDVTIANAQVGGATVAPPDTLCYGPFDIPGLQQFWVCTAPSVPGWFSVAIDIDSDPGPDLQVFGVQLAEALKGFDQASVNAAIAKVIEVWKG